MLLSDEGSRGTRRAFGLGWAIRWGVALAVPFGAPLQADEITPRGANSYQILTGDDIDGDRTHWDQLYRKKGYLFGTEPAAFLKEVLPRLPRG
jgi:hypothetical protein